MKKLLIFGLAVALAASPCESLAQKTMLKRVWLGTKGVGQGLVATLCLMGDAYLVAKGCGNTLQGSTSRAGKTTDGGHIVSRKLMGENFLSISFYTAVLTAIGGPCGYCAYNNFKEAFSSDNAVQPTSTPAAEEKSLSQVVTDAKSAESGKGQEAVTLQKVS